VKRTMNDEYGDGSDHEVCTRCGACIPCDHSKRPTGKELCRLLPEDQRSVAASAAISSSYGR
jgi:hypothetical protein